MTDELARLRALLEAAKATALADVGADDRPTLAAHFDALAAAIDPEHVEAYTREVEGIALDVATKTGRTPDAEAARFLARRVAWLAEQDEPLDPEDLDALGIDAPDDGTLFGATHPAVLAAGVARGARWYRERRGVHFRASPYLASLEAADRLRAEASRPFDVTAPGLAGLAARAVVNETDAAVPDGIDLDRATVELAKEAHAALAAFVAVAALPGPIFHALGPTAWPPGPYTRSAVTALVNLAATDSAAAAAIDAGNPSPAWADEDAHALRLDGGVPWLSARLADFLAERWPGAGNVIDRWRDRAAAEASRPFGVWGIPGTWPGPVDDAREPVPLFAYVVARVVWNATVQPRLAREADKGAAALPRQLAIWTSEIAQRPRVVVVGREAGHAGTLDYRHAQRVEVYAPGLTPAGLKRLREALGKHEPRVTDAVARVLALDAFDRFNAAASHDPRSRVWHGAADLQRAIEERLGMPWSKRWTALDVENACWLLRGQDRPDGDRSFLAEFDPRHGSRDRTDGRRRAWRMLYGSLVMPGAVFDEDGEDRQLIPVVRTPSIGSQLKLADRLHGLQWATLLDMRKHARVYADGLYAPLARAVSLADAAGLEPDQARRAFDGWLSEDDGWIRPTPEGGAMLTEPGPHEMIREAARLAEAKKRRATWASRKGRT